MVSFFRYSLYTLLLIGLTIPSVRAADHAGIDADPAKDKAAATATSGDVISPRELEQIVTGFGTNEAFVRGRWDAKLPAALDASRKDKKEEDVAAIFAKLTGLVNGEQMKKLGEQANTSAGNIDSQENRYAELLKHMVWTKEIFFPSEKKDSLKFKAEGEEFEKYKKAFLEKWEEQKKKNDEFHDLLKDASGDDKAKKDKAVEALRTKYDPKALLSFIEAQAKSGNKEVADKLGVALGLSENATNFLDAVNKNGDKVRIIFDKENPPSVALAKFAEESKTPVSQLTFSPTKHDKPGITFTPGKEAGKGITQDSSATKVESSGAAAKTTEAGNSGNAGSRGNNGGAKQTKPEVDIGTAKGVAAIALLTAEKSCASCHSGNNVKGEFDLGEYVKNPNKEKLIRMFERVVKDGDMPPARNPARDAQYKATIRAWAKENGIE